MRRMAMRRTDCSERHAWRGPDFCRAAAACGSVGTPARVISLPGNMLSHANNPHADAPVEDKRLAWHSRLERLAKTPDTLQFVPATLDWIMELRTDPAAALALLFQSLERGARRERMLVVKLLCYFHADEAVAALVRAAHDGDERVAAEAARSLSMAEWFDTTVSLLELVRNSSSGLVVANALYGLCRIGSDEGMALAARFVADEARASKLRWLLASNVAQRREPHLWPFIEHVAEVQAQDARVMNEVVLHCIELDTPEAKRRLSVISNDPRVDARIRAAARAHGAQPN